MFPPDFFTLETLRLAATGGAISAGLALLYYAWSDRDYLLHRWQMRQMAKELGRPFESMPELEGYSSGILTPQERSRVPGQVAGVAMAGALLALPLQIDQQQAETIVAVGIALFGIVYVLASDDAEEVGVPVDPYAPPLQRKSRWERIRPHLGQIIFVGLSLLAVASHKSLGLVFEIIPGTSLDLFWVMAFIAASGAFVWRYRRGPPQGMDFEEEREWDKETAALLVIAIGIVSISLLVWLN